MTADITKLSPRPFHERRSDTHILDSEYRLIADFIRSPDAAFFLLATQAYDILMNRKWQPFFNIVNADGVQSWGVMLGEGEGEYPRDDHPNPFEALVCCEAWFVDQQTSATQAGA